MNITLNASQQKTKLVTRAMHAHAVGVLKIDTTQHTCRHFVSSSGHNRIQNLLPSVILLHPVARPRLVLNLVVTTNSYQ